MLFRSIKNTLKAKDLAKAIESLQEDNKRLQKEVAWFEEKNDYRNKDKDWGNSADSIQRGMQKLRGSDPSLPPHVLKK